MTVRLTEFLERPDATVEEGALILAQDAYPSLRVERYLRQLDTWADALRPKFAEPRPPLASSKLLGDFFNLELMFRGNHDDYYDVKNSYLNDVIDRKQGIPLTLSMVLLGIARRLGVNAEGIMFPGHFLIRVGGPRGYLLDAFAGARIVDDAGLRHLLSRALGANAELSNEHLQVADTRTMLVRMLNNLRGIFQSQGDHARTMLVCNHLVDLDVGPLAIRDRGLAAFARGAYETARSDLTAYLEARPDAGDKSTIEKALRDASTPRALN